MRSQSNYIRRKKLHPFLLVRYARIFLKPAIRKKALLVAAGSAGGMGDPLIGAQLDVEKMRNLLIKQFGYKPKDITVLTDKPGSSEDVQPTYTNIMNKLERFLDDQISGTRYFFYYAGHTAQQPSDDDDEEDGKDECILPSDSRPQTRDSQLLNGNYYENCILDGDLKKHLVNRLFPESRLVAILDSCHSGTLLDLPHFRCNRVYAMTSLWRRAVRRVVESYRKRGDRLFSLVSSLAPTLSIDHEQDSDRPVCSGFCPRTEWSHNVVCISACKDDQKAYEAGDGVSSLTNLIIQFLEKEPHPTLKHFMRQTTARFRALSKRLKKQWNGPGEFGPIAAPQVSSPEPLDMNKHLVI